MTQKQSVFLHASGQKRFPCLLQYLCASPKHEYRVLLQHRRIINNNLRSLTPWQCASDCRAYTRIHQKWVRWHFRRWSGYYKITDPKTRTDRGSQRHNSNATDIFPSLLAAIGHHCINHDIKPLNQ